MKKIEAIIRPHKLEEVRDDLQEAGFRGLTVLEVKGYGRQKGQTAVYRGSEYSIDFRPKVKVELVCPDNKVDEAIGVIIRRARTGDIGDGKIFVSTVGEAIRIRTSESGREAL
jgi:nitrogen regulatory protein P-II 1